MHKKIPAVGCAMVMMLAVAIIPFTADTIQAGPALVCTPLVSGFESVQCGADGSETCGTLAGEADLDEIDCRATYLGDCEVTDEGHTITEWAVEASFYDDSGSGDRLAVGVECDGEMIVDCSAAPPREDGEYGICADRTQEIGTGDAYCVVWNDSTGGGVPDDWVYEAACEDPPAIPV